jgi:hypothetical protein
VSKTTEKYTPEWISEEEALRWLGVDRITLFRYRKSLGLAFSYLNGTRTLMYDRKQINEILNSNSTYSVVGDKKLTA